MSDFANCENFRVFHENLMNLINLTDQISMFCLWSGLGEGVTVHVQNTQHALNLRIMVNFLTIFVV